MSIRIWALSSILLSGCVSVSRPTPVSTVEVLQNIHAWNGKEVTVEGWLGKCLGLDCGIYASLEDARIVAGGQFSEPQWRNAMERRLSIAFDRRFDREANPLQFEKVLLRGRVSDECRGENICKDRASDIYPISIHPA